MKSRTTTTSLAVALTTGLLLSTGTSAQDALPQADNPWLTSAQSEIQKRLAQQPNTNRAKNVVIMIADGNGVGTNYATRLFHGQQNGNYGDENILP